LNRPLFRVEALEHATSAAPGDVLRISPSWTRWTYWLLAAAAFVALGYLVLGRVSQYATGPAVVVISGRVDVVAYLSGTVSSVEVASGDRVEAGEKLVTLHAAKETAEVERIQREFDLQLVKTLRDPADDIARRALTALRAEKDLASARLAELTIRAPRAGIVGDLHTRRGQALAVGDVVLTLAPDDARCSVVAMIPGHSRPQLQPGMPVRFEISGYWYAYQELRIASIDSQIIGPAEVKRYLGPELGDAVAVEGPVNLVKAELPSCAFAVDGQSFDVHHGMSGAASVRVRSEPILVALVPAVRALLARRP
jgi:membrane fusion protein (multidrug efflux system)